MHRSSRARKALPLALASCLALAVVAPVVSTAEARAPFIHESRAAYEQQLARGQIQAAEFNKRVRSLHLTLKDGRRYLTKYGAHEEPTLLSQLQAKGVPVSIEKTSSAPKEAKKPVKHKLRYIAGGIVVVVVVVVGAVLLIDRRRKTTPE